MLVASSSRTARADGRPFLAPCPPATAACRVTLPSPPLHTITRAPAASNPPLGVFLNIDPADTCKPPGGRQRAQMHAVGTAHVVTGLEGVRSFGAVRDSAMTPAARIAMATTAVAIFAGLSVKRSSNSQMLKMMLASGLMMTRSG